MVERGSGDVFFMASVASLVGYPRGVAYGAAKHGLLGLARSLREETKEHGLRVVSLLPGATYTDSWAASGLPEERFMPPEDLAALVVAIHGMDRRTVVEEVLLRPQLCPFGCRRQTHRSAPRWRPARARRTRRAPRWRLC
jgi:short-subunit dehydrogenase